MISQLSNTKQWCLLVPLSLLMGLFLYQCHIPAALLIGPMIVAIIMSLLGCSVRLPIKLFWGAQAILGCMIAQNLTSNLITPLLTYWPYIIIMTLLTLLASTFVGWLLVRYSPLPGSTGAWGTAPGGASAMVAMSIEYDADVRLVAFIQYLRVILVISLTTLVAHYLASGTVKARHHEVIWFPQVSYQLIVTLCIGLCGAYIGRRFSIPSGTMLVPMLLATTMHTAGFATLELPQWLLLFAYMSIGLMIGLRFNIAVFRLAMRSLLQIMMSIITLITLCTLFAILLSYSAGVDFLSAFLATSPGGLDTVAIIAAGTESNLPLIIAMQTLRLLSVLFIGPIIARYLARYVRRTHLTSFAEVKNHPSQ